MSHPTLIEPLEARIAPATIVNPYTVTYQDLDYNSSGAQVQGDTVVVHISKPLFTSVTAAGNILGFLDVNGNSVPSNSGFSGNSTGEFLNVINLIGNHKAQDMDISVKVLPQDGVGNGTVNVGTIEAGNFSTPYQVSGNIDLGNIYIQGNLGRIFAGDNFSTPAIQSLTVGSMNEYVQTSSGLESFVLGPIVSMNVKGDFTSNLNVIGYQYGTIDKLVIGGSLTADSAADAQNPGTTIAGGDQDSGQINFTGHIGSATIGSIIGGNENSGASGQDQATGELIGSTTNSSYIGSLHVLGDITGGAGSQSGRVFAQVGIKKVIVDGSVTGGAGQDSGEIAGPLGQIKIAGDLAGSTGVNSGIILSEVYNASTGSISPAPLGSVTIGGDVVGGSAADSSSILGNSGEISASTAHSISIAGSLMGGSTAGADNSGAILVNSVSSVTIGKSIIGGAASNSGIITGQSTSAVMNYGHIVVDGDMQGGSGATSGAILVNSVGFSGGRFISGSIANLQVKGSVIGGSGTESGEVSTAGSLGALSIGGNVTGGTANDSGVFLIGGTLTSGVIHGNLTGASVATSTALMDSGYIQAGAIDALNIQGSVTAGANTHTTLSGTTNTPDGSIINSGSIRSKSDIVSLTIGGDVNGSVNTYNETTASNSPTGTIINPVFISAAEGPNLTKSSKTDLAIGSVTFGQNVNYLDLLAGYSPSGTSTALLGTPADSTAQIASVLVKGNLSATNIVAGAAPGSTGQFGTSGDTALTVTPGNSKLASMIASIVVDGNATGDSNAGDTFGFVAEQVVKVVAANAPSLILHPGPDNDFLVPVNDGGPPTNLVVNEVD